MPVEKAERRTEERVKAERAKQEKAAQKKKLDRDAKSAAGRESQYRYRKRKKAVAEKEEKNYRYLYIFQSNEKAWWKMGWHSVLFFRYIVARRIQHEANVNNDHDFGLKSPTGIISLRDEGLPSLISQMYELGYRVDRRRSSETVKVVDLGYKISAEDVKRYEHEEEAKLERLNKLAPVVINIPEVDGKLREITKRIYNAVNRMPEPGRKMMGYGIAELAISAMKAYQYMAWGGITPEEALKRIKKALMALKVQVNVATRIDILDRDIAAKLGVDIVEAERLIKPWLGEKIDDAAGDVIRKNEGLK